MQRSIVISSILRDLEYRSVEENSETWKRVEQILDSVLDMYRNAGYFRNLQRRNVTLEQITDLVQLAPFAPFKTVFKLPSDFGSLDTHFDGLIIQKEGNGFYLMKDDLVCSNFYGKIDYSIKPDHSDFSWCEPVMLNAIISECVFKIKAIDSGQGLNYFSQASAKNLAYARKIRTKRDIPRFFGGW